MDNSRWVGVSVNSVSLHVTDYMNYADFRKSIDEAAGEFFRLHEKVIERVSRIGLVYTNNILLARDLDQNLPLDSYLQLGLMLPGVLGPGMLEDIQLQFSKRCDGMQTVVALRRFDAHEGSPEHLRLVLDAAIADEVAVKDWLGKLDTVHERIEAIFEGIVTDEYMALMKGGIS